MRFNVAAFGLLPAGASAFVQLSSPVFTSTHLRAADGQLEDLVAAYQQNNNEPAKYPKWLGLLRSLLSLQQPQFGHWIGCMFLGNLHQRLKWFVNLGTSQCVHHITTKANLEYFVSHICVHACGFYYYSPQKLSSHPPTTGASSGIVCICVYFAHWSVISVPSIKSWLWEFRQDNSRPKFVWSKVGR